MTADRSTEENLSLVRKIGIVLTILVLFAAAGYWFLFPWLPRPTLGGDVLEQFSPAGGGRSSLYKITNANGEAIAWESHNFADLPGIFMIDIIAANDDLYAGLSYVLGFDPQGSELVNNYNPTTLRFSEQAIYRTDLERNELENYSHIYVQSDSGQHLLLNFETDTGEIRPFVPPVPQWPGQLLTRAPNSLDQDGFFPQSKQGYSSRRTIEWFTDIPAEWEPYQPCVLISQELDLPELSETSSVEQLYCDQMGLVYEKQLDSEGVIISQKTLMSTTLGDIGKNPIDAWQTEFSGVEPPALPADVDVSEWTLSRFTNLPIVGFAGQPTQPLTPFADPPILVSSRTNGTIVAINYQTAEVEWSLASANTVYGTPALNPANQIMYAGSSSKRLLAFSADGMFLDAFQTDDSVVTRPVFGAETVFFASEDGHIYCAPANLDPENTRSLDLDNPVVGSPVLVDGLAVFGTDSGTVTAVDAQCNLAWQFETDEPVDAPLTQDQDRVVYFAGFSQIGALNGTDGNEVWTTPIYASVHVQPVLTSRLLLTVDIDFRLNGYDRESGRLLWSNADYSYVGAPLAVGDQFLISSDDGYLNLFDLEGRITKRWPLSAVTLETDQQQTHPLFSPVIANGAIWFVDTGGVIYRLGALEN